MIPPTPRAATARCSCVLLASLAGTFLLAAAPAAEGLPGEITVQGYLEDSEGAPAEGDYDLTITLYDDQSGTAALWTETIPGIPVIRGLFDVAIGANAFNPLDPSVFVDHAQVWLGITVEGGPDVPEEGEGELPRRRFTTVGYAFAAAQAAVASALDCSGCVSADALGFDAVTTEELAAALVEIGGAPITTVDGLAGGTISGDLAITGKLSQGGQLVCDASGSCGQMLSNVTCGVEQVLRWSGEAWTCADAGAGGGPTPPACIGGGKGLQWTGSEFVCATLGNPNLSSGSANGYEVKDAWGYGFDGVQRAAAPWQVAHDTCAAMGGRLPTATELVRNNAASGTGNLSDDKASSSLWTMLPTEKAGERITVRLDTGVVAVSQETVDSAYRCVWPDHTGDAFEGDHCFGPPGEECRAYGLWWNVDRFDRPALPYVAAVHECGFYNASIPTMSDQGQLIHEGWEAPSNEWLWASDAKYWHNGGHGLSLIRWSIDPQPEWGYGGAAFASFNWASASHRFRCIGKRSSSEGVLDGSPPCEGGCFVADSGRQARLAADGADREPLTYPAAAELCRLLGGSLPHIGEVTDLVHDGWLGDLPEEDPLDPWRWTSDPIYYFQGNYGYMRYRRHYADDFRWAIGTTTFDAELPTSPSAFRCVWHETYDAQTTGCGPAHDQIFDGDGFVCAPSGDGDSAGAANPGGIQLVDGWGNAWDLIQRPGATYAEAEESCAFLGGRLPAPTEVYRVRSDQTLVDAIGDENDTSELWTLLDSSTPGNVITIRVSDGVTDHAAKTGEQPYRCVWPTSKGDVFGSRSCYGEPDAPCFESGRLRMDLYDRPAVPASSAELECALFGGRLPDVDQMGELLHGEAPNGSDLWLWLDEPMIWYDGFSGHSRGYGLARWNETSTAEWTYQHPAWGALSDKDQFRPFRCIFTDRME